MNFDKAFKLMKDGLGIKLPSWAGYWFWDNQKETIIMHCKDGKKVDIRETQVVEYTLQNILSDEWIIADAGSTPVLGGTATFNFGEAIKYLKRGLKVARSGWNGKGMHLKLVPNGYYDVGLSIVEEPCEGLLPWIGMKTADNKFVPWLASQTDILAEDYTFVD
ncbi:DUF2829 domain-containing protein [Clostridium intestinale]|uniref:DUF2829 domain-containing protein n=1 Tax=Clostridium intestinale TaxID=36845 RepID=UPI002DD62F1D|nr:DUF2829 domain-containing protein [Clostridium intestinale]WRY53124.1 DUF2829 domain-containing protein [Clostridium intestinale]